MKNKALSWLEEAVRSNPRDFAARVSLLNVVRDDAAALERERAAFAAALPLTAPLWLDWLPPLLRRLRAAAAAAGGEEEEEEEEEDSFRAQAERLTRLSQQATEDCPHSAELWLLHTDVLQLCSLVLTDAVTFEQIREKFEHALLHVGHHPAEGHTVWISYYEWEDEQLTTMESSEVPAEMLTVQTNRVRNLFSRALHAPLLQLDAIWELYIEWEVDEKKKEGLKKRLAAGKAALEARKAKEAAVADALLQPQQDQNASLYKEVCEYLTWEEQQLTGKKEKGKRDPSSGMSLFERALAVFGAVPELWLWYLSFLSKWGREDLPLKWACRAPRRCWWSGSVLVTSACLLFPTERRDEGVALLKSAISNGVLGGADDIHAVFCGLEDLNGDSDVAHLQMLDAYFSDRVDLKSEVLQVQAAKALQSGNFALFHQCWEQALRIHGSKSWDVWSRYLHTCPTSNEEHLNKCRLLWKQAVQSVADWPEAVLASWKRWERVFGSPETQLQAQIVSERRGRLVASQREQQAAAAAAAVAASVSSSNIIPLAVPLSGPPAAAQSDKKKRTLFVKNIAFEADESKLEEVFRPFGELAEVRLIKGESKF